MTAAVLETLIPPEQSSEQASGAPRDPETVEVAVPLTNTSDPDLAYSEAPEWRWMPADTFDHVADSWHALPAVVFVIVQSVLLLETVVAFISLQGQAWQPVGVLIIALLVMGLSVSFLAGVAVARTEQSAPTPGLDECGRWWVIPTLPTAGGSSIASR